MLFGVQYKSVLKVVPVETGSIYVEHLVFSAKKWLFLNLSCIFKEVKTKGKHLDKHGKNICRLSHILVQYLFTSSEKGLDHYHQKLNIRVASWVAERLKIYVFRKLGNFKGIPKMLEFDGNLLTRLPERKTSTVVLQNWRKSSVKHSIFQLQNIPNIFHILLIF